MFISKSVLITAVVLYKIVTLTLLSLLLLSCSGFKNYKVSTKYLYENSASYYVDNCHQYEGCHSYFAGECWNRVNYTLASTYATDPVTGLYRRVPKTTRMVELRDKSFRILLESPPDAPLQQIWLVYTRLKRDLPWAREQAGMSGTISPRRSLR